MKMPQISINKAVKQPALLLFTSLFVSAFLFIENAQCQTAPQIKGRSVFAPYQPEPKFAPARGEQSQSTNTLNDKEDTSGQFSQPIENPTRDQPNNQTKVQAPFSANPDGTPALNIVPTIERPPIPPPPDTTPLRPSGNGIVRPAQAWRVKAFQLFKQKVDPNNTVSVLLNANYNSALLALRQTFEDEGLIVSGISASAGHMLITLTTNNINSEKVSEKAIVALRPALPEASREPTKEAIKEGSKLTKSDRSSEAKTELRAMCESRNKSLTCQRMKGILNKLQSKFGDIKTDAETL
jgi:hypothetical protein